MIARLAKAARGAARVLRWIFTTRKPCNRPDCTEGQLCDDCAAFWAIK